MAFWLQGYVTVKIKGERLERLINRMMNQRFEAWNIQRSSPDEAVFSITVAHFFKLRELLKQTDCKAVVLKRVGLPFFLRRVRRRAGLATGLALFFLTLYILSNMVWSIEIEGVKLPENEIAIREELAKLGVKQGAFKFRLEDGATIQRKLMQVLPSTTWIGYELVGTKAQITVVEKTLPNIPQPTNPRHLIAKKKAIVYDLFVEKGVPQVKPNQFVHPGDILVSGFIGREESPEIVSAKGIIWGEVWYEGKVSVPLEQQRTQITGERRTKRYLTLWNYPIKIWGFGKISYDSYRTIDHDKQLSIGDWTFPIGIRDVDIYETVNVTSEITEDEAIEIGKHIAREELMRKLDLTAEIAEENILRKHTENGKVYIKMHFTVIEDITAEQIIIQGD